MGLGLMSSGEEIFDALVDCLAEAMTAGFDQSAADHILMRDKGNELRSGETMIALLGPKLARLAQNILKAAEHKAVKRYATYRAHVRYSSDPLIYELEDARSTFSAALLKAQGTNATALDALKLVIAQIRVAAVTTALGSDCIAVPKTNLKAAAPSPRRREISAVDIDENVAQTLLVMTAVGGDWDAGIAALRSIEGSPANKGGIVTSIIALAQDVDGEIHLQKIRARLERALSERAICTGIAARPSAPKANVSASLKQRAAKPVTVPIRSPTTIEMDVQKQRGASAAPPKMHRGQTMPQKQAAASTAEAHRTLAERFRAPSRQDSRDILAARQAEALKNRRGR